MVAAPVGNVSDLHRIVLGDGLRMSTFLDEQLSTVRVCNGLRELTTDPSDVVDITDDGVGIRWGEYVHSIAANGGPVWLRGGCRRG